MYVNNAQGVPWEGRLHFTWALLIKPICDQNVPLSDISLCIKFPQHISWLTSLSALSWSRLRVTFPCGSGLLRSTVMCKVRRRSPRSSSSSAASRTILLTRPLLGACVVAGAPTPPPPGAETPISGSAGDEEPQHHFGATSGIRIAKRKKKEKRQRKEEGKSIGGGADEWLGEKCYRWIWIQWGFFFFFFDCPELKCVLFHRLLMEFGFSNQTRYKSMVWYTNRYTAGLTQRAALTLSALVAPLVKPPSSGNLQPSWPVVSPPHSQPHTSLFTPRVHFRRFTHFLFCPHSALPNALLDETTFLREREKKVQVVKKKRKKEHLCLHGGVVSVSKTVFIHSAADREPHRNEDARLNESCWRKQVKPYQTTAFQDTRCSCCALLRWFYTIRPCAGALPPG